MSFETIHFDKIPEGLRLFPTWVLWQIEDRGDKPTKVPYQICGQRAASNNRDTWESFENVKDRYLEGGYAGVGFMFTTDIAGVDLDGCRNPETGIVADWAKEIILKFDSYAEVSPSKTGIKIFCRGAWGPGKKVRVDQPKVNEKEPGVEVYDHGRYFAVTGWKVQGPKEPERRQEVLNWLRETYFPGPQAPQLDFRSDDAVVERARMYLTKLPPAISGQSGHNATFHAACVLVLGFQLSQADALGLMYEYNQRCQPPWTEKELFHKVTQAEKQPGERGYLRNAAVNRWGAIPVPSYKPPAQVVEMPAPPVFLPTLGDAAVSYLEKLKTDKGVLVELGIPDLDYAIGGGVDFGEMVIFAARPSHGKSAVALQCLHTWTKAGMPCAMVSEEMSSLALGKRTLQFLSPMPQEHWFTSVETLEHEVQAYKEAHAGCYILEGCGTVKAAIDGLERAVKEHGIKCAVVDYAQLLQSPGKSRYEQVTNTSIALRQFASTRKIVLLALVQANRDLDTRPTFEPTLRDLKDTGQFEQDADVVVFLCWPHKIDPMQPKSKYQFFVLKVRNREINQRAVVCHFNAARQTVKDEMPSVPQSNIHAQNGGI
jgi:archaellum biogenesis ATPase FlaH